MSSRGSETTVVVWFGQRSFVEKQPAKHLIGQASLEETQRRGLGLAVRHPRLDEGTAVADTSPLCDRDPVQRCVDLAVAATAEPKAFAARPHRDWSSSVPASERGTRTEPPRTRHLADDLGRRQHTATRQLQQRGSHRADERGDLTLELVAAHGQLPDPLNELGGDSCDGPVESLQLRRDTVEVEKLPECLRGQIQLWHQLVKMPTKPGLHAGALRDQVLAVIHQNLDTPCLSLQ